MGIGDWGLGVGANPQSPIYFKNFYIIYFYQHFINKLFINFFLDKIYMFEHILLKQRGLHKAKYKINLKRKRLKIIEINYNF